MQKTLQRTKYHLNIGFFAEKTSTLAKIIIACSLEALYRWISCSLLTKAVCSIVLCLSANSFGLTLQGQYAGNPYLERLARRVETLRRLLYGDQDTEKVRPVSSLGECWLLAMMQQSTWCSGLSLQSHRPNRGLTIKSRYLSHNLKVDRVVIMLWIIHATKTTNLSKLLHLLCFSTKQDG